MSKLRLHGTSSGYTDIAPTAAAGNNTLTAPTGTGTLVAQDAAGAIGITSVQATNANFSGTARITTGIVTSFSGDITLPTGSLIVNADNTDAIKLGASADLLLYHDGSNSKIKNVNTGRLHIENSAGVIRTNTDSGFYIQSADGNTEHARVDSSGANIAGVCTAAVFVPSTGQLSNRNVIINGDMRIAQRGTSTTTINEYLIDRWRNYGGPMGATWSQQTDATAYPRSRYAFRQHRTVGNSQTNNTGVGQGIETKNSYQLAGQTVTLSFKARCGANFSGASNVLVSRINGGEGTDENPFGMTNTNGDSQNNTLTTSVQRFIHTWTIPSDKTQVTLLFDYNPVGTAGANDWFEIAEVQLEVGSTATPFEYRSYNEELQKCMRYYQIVHNVQLTGAKNTTTRMRINQNNFMVPMRGDPSYSRTSNSLSFQLAATNTQSSDTTEAQGGFSGQSNGDSYGRQWDFGGFTSLADRTYVGNNASAVFTLDADL